MVTHTVQRSLAVTGAAVLLTALAGCSLLGQSPEPENTSAANDAAAAKFVACLTEQGQTAKIMDGGMVALLLAESFDDDGPGSFSSDDMGDGGPQGMVAIMQDDEGQWMASTSAEGYPEDGGLREAWQACETEVPEFEQPEPAMNGEGDSVTAEDQVEAALAFAQCARDSGFADFPDPGDDGSMNLPSDISEDGFRQLLEDCFDPEKPMGLMIDKETADALDFDLMAVMQDFMEAHPEFGGPQQSSGGTTGAK
jgi:hypothetical protein